MNGRRAALVALLLSLVSVPVSAAELYFGAHSPEVGLHTTFEVGVFLNTEGASVNAIEGKVEFPADALEFQGTKDGGSVVSFWVEKPDARREEIMFSGIIPGGYAGRNGYLFSIFFRAKGLGEANIASLGERVFLSDGRGSEGGVRGAPLSLRVTESGLGVEFLPARDTDPPEPFTPSIARDLAVFDGRWFIVFATQDKGLGIDHYELKEPRYGIGKWRAVASPFLLGNQALDGPVYVKAVDNAGNARIAVLPPQNPRSYEDAVVWGIIILIAALFTRKRNLWGEVFRS